jgi:hypothetical protein
MSLLDAFVRCASQIRCPICDKLDWCMVSRDNPNDPSTVICARIESRYRWGEAGWFHELREQPTRRGRHGPRLITLSTAVPLELAQLANRTSVALDGEHALQLATSLGVTVDSLHRLNVGWLESDRKSRIAAVRSSDVWTFPMRDANDRIIGVRLRLPDGQKRAVCGSSNGLFIPAGITPHPELLLVTEGESDCAALLDLGFDAIGRPGCNSGTKLVTQYVRRLRPESVAVISDNDEQGRAGAVRLGVLLRAYCRRLHIVTPPDGVKDAREWKRAGVTAADIAAAINAAETLDLALIMRRRGGTR